MYYQPPSILTAKRIRSEVSHDLTETKLIELTPVDLECLQDNGNALPRYVVSREGNEKRINEDSLSDFSVDDDIEDPDFVPCDEKKYHEESSIAVLDVSEKAMNTSLVGSVLDSESEEEDNVQNPEETVDNDTNEKDDLKMKKSRKLQRNEKNWQRNIKKRKINSGEEYISRLGKKHEAKKVLPSCDNKKCQYRCTEKISEADRTELFQKFYRLGNKTLQREYLARNIERIQPKNEKVYKKRKIICAYYFTTNNQKIRVCKLFFKNTLNISNNSIDTVLKKKNEFDFLTPEKRGTHSNRANKVNDSLVKGIIDHVNSFPRTESHYCRSSTSKEYLEGSLNISMMYRLYKEKCQESNEPFVKEHFYKEVFNNKFNLGFFKPKKDLCSVCETFKNLTEVEKENKKEQFEIHTKEKALARKEKDSDKNSALNDKNILLSTFDLQAVTPLPNGNVSTFYYKSKLNVFNFTLFNIPEKKGSCYIWHEGEAKRGANEISTCVFNYIKTFGIGKDIIFFSDDCSSQNKNRFLISMYLYAVEYLNVPQITHKYLIIGHTENEGDSMHSCIEKERSRILKSGPIYIPSEFVTLVKSAKKKGEPYLVNEMATENFIDWKKISSLMGSNFNKNVEGEKVTWNDIKIIRVKKGEANKIFYKTSFAQECFQVINIREKTRKKRMENISLVPAYTKPPNIPNNKKEDLVSLCNDNLIPKRHHQFFMSLNGGPTTADPDSE